VSSRWAWRTAGLAGVLVASACQSERMVRYPPPAGAADPGPAIAVTTTGDKGVVEEGKAVMHADGVVNLRPMAEATVTAVASDAVVGISSFGLRINRRAPVSPGSRPLYAVSTHSTIDRAKGQVPEALTISGSNSAGGPGSTPLRFALDGYDVVTLIATARSAGGATRTIVVTYRAAGGALLEPDSDRFNRTPPSQTR